MPSQPVPLGSNGFGIAQPTSPRAPGGRVAGPFLCTPTVSTHKSALMRTGLSTFAPHLARQRGPGRATGDLPPSFALPVLVPLFPWLGVA